MRAIARCACVCACACATPHRGFPIERRLWVCSPIPSTACSCGKYLTQRLAESHAGAPHDLSQWRIVVVSSPQIRGSVINLNSLFARPKSPGDSHRIKMGICNSSLGLLPGAEVPLCPFFALASGSPGSEGKHGMNLMHTPHRHVALGS